MRHHQPWTRASRLGSVRSIVVLALASVSLGASVERADAVPPSIAGDAPTVAWTDQVTWGIGRFAAAGLELPSRLAVEVHEDDAACHGNSGRYEPGESPVVHLCAAVEPGSRVARLITLHELAHAWAETQLGPDERDAFLNVRHLDVWIDGDVEPYLWGAEHAAEVVSWGLMDEEVSIIRVGDAEPAQLAVAFDTLADEAPLWQQADAN